MTLDDGLCYRALTSRDRRFDGRFFVGVLSTGIFCRPICPAPTPLRRNVRFFSCAAAASEAGLRPCLRCRPEAAPGTPAWLGTSATVARALRLIESGALDRGDVDSLAERMGIGERHLRRLFETHLGASPVAVAQTQRLLFAKKLLDETNLPITEIAFAAGFSSVRRFNASISSAYGRPPSQLRRSRRGRASAVADTPGLELRLPYRAPFDWQSVVRYLAARAIPGVECASEESYRRSVALEGGSVVVEVGPVPGEDALWLRIPAPAARSLVGVVERMRRVFDLRADPAAIASDLSNDPQMKDLLAQRPGLRVPGAWDGFELAVRVVLGQQVSVPRATEMAGALTRAFGAALPEPHGEITHLFPRPADLAEADVAGLGLMPGARAEAIRSLARAVRDAELDLDAPESAEAARATLAAIPGLGPWSVELIALRALGEPDAFPAGDLGLRKATGPVGEALAAAKLEARSEAWRPWRSYAAMQLWHAAPGEAFLEPARTSKAPGKRGARSPARPRARSDRRPARRPGRGDEARPTGSAPPRSPR